MEAIKLNKKSLEKSLKVLKQGGIVIFPTDTVYGFLADATNKKAVAKIFKIKKRLRSKPLPVFISDIKIAKDLAEIGNKQIKVLKNKWPGKYTFVFKIKKSIKLFGQDKNTIALRIPKFKPLNNLLKKIGKPLVQTSVNVSGESALIKISDIINQFKNKDILMVDAGNLKKSKPSKIIDLASNKLKILRP
jgi:L-threonylcarbamoyladenylate synthase